MNQLKAYISLSLIGVLIFSTLGFSVSRHYCMGMLVEESFYQFDPAGCGMMDNDSCEDEDEHLTGSCCDDENIVISGIDVLNFGQDDQAQKNFTPDLDPTAQTLMVFNPSLNDLPIASDSSPPPKPLYGRQLLVSFQRFLI